MYGEPASVPCTEDFPTAALNPYGRTKLFIEHILGDLQASDPAWQVVLLRYFNPVGAHPSVGRQHTQHVLTTCVHAHCCTTPEPLNP